MNPITKNNNKNITNHKPPRKSTRLPSTDMRVYLANPRGFCAGVIMAVEVVDQILDICPDIRPIFVYHEIVHNKHVVNRFEKRGVIFVENINQVPQNSIVVFSAHGVSPEIRRIAKQQNLTAIDATCPLVTKVHMEAIRYARAGYQILLIGHAGHDEVVGTIGEVPDAIQVVQSPKDIPNLEVKNPKKLVYLTQTTLSLNDAEIVITALKKAFPEIKEPPSDDICYATTNRQWVVRNMAQQCDLVLVVGSRNSSNSLRLTEIAQAVGTPAHLIDDETEFRESWFEGINRVLVTSGASAPEDLVRGLLHRLIRDYDATVQQIDVFDERMEFGLPGSLKDLMRNNKINPNGRTISIEQGDMIEKWLAEFGGAPKNEPVHLTISANSNNLIPT